MARLKRIPILGLRSIISLAVCLPKFSHLTQGLNGSSTPYPRDVRWIARMQRHTNIGDQRMTFCTPKEVAQSANLHEHHRRGNACIPIIIRGNYPVKQLGLLAAAQDFELVHYSIANHLIDYRPSSEPHPFDSNCPSGCTTFCRFSDRFSSSPLVNGPTITESLGRNRWRCRTVVL